jgi:hypothetical protein
MEEFKIVNKLNILHDISIINKDSILIKFRSFGDFDLNTEIFEIEIFGDQVSRSAERLKEIHLDTPTVITEELPNELTFYIGEFDMTEDWGSDISLNIINYKTRFVCKRITDWKIQYISLIRNIAKTKSFRETNPEPDRFAIMKYTEDYQISSSALPMETKDELKMMTTKIENLDNAAFYNIFLRDFEPEGLISF